MKGVGRILFTLCMRYWRGLICFLGLLATGVAGPVGPESLTVPLVGYGPTSADRVTWDALAVSPGGKKLISAAVKVAKEPMPEFDAVLYDEYFRTGNRTHYQTSHSKRWGRLHPLVLGECLENRGRFLAAIEVTIRSLCADPTWCLPAHDHGGKLVKGGKPYVDLAVAGCGYDLATAVYLVGDKLSPAVQATAREAIRRMVVAPVQDHMAGRDKEYFRARHWWSRADNNWNAVCHAGAIGALLLTTPSRDERAAAIQWAEENLKAFFNGFAPDGYCSEGMGYWNYGFGHYVLLAELVRLQTGGKVDWLADPRVEKITRAALGQEILPGLYPSFADAPLRSQPDTNLVDFLCKRGLAAAANPRATDELMQARPLFAGMTYAFCRPPAGSARVEVATPERRTWLADGGVFVGRPAHPDGLGVAWKGGHNAEHHNHNDVGSTAVYWRGQPILCDPGAMEYVAGTFGADRYRFPVMNSFGHAVPVIDGRLQKTGRDAKAVLVKSQFGDVMDTMTMDMRACYAVPGLKLSERTWTFSRQQSGALVIEDRFEAEAVMDFSTALIGLGTWRSGGGDNLFVIEGTGNHLLNVRVEASGALAHEVVTLPNPNRPTVNRLGVSLRDKAGNGWIRLTIMPRRDDAGAPGDPVPVARTAPAMMDVAGDGRMAR